MAYTLIIGNKNYSSWSLRGWLALAATGAPFEEVVIALDQPETRAAIAAHSPAGRVPILKAGALVVHDSLAIAEFLAERHPDRHLWPRSADARAVARSVVSEMHAGFAALREQLPMNIRRKVDGVRPDEAARADIERITAIWRNCLAEWGGDGPYLFGAYSIADMYYAPVVMRFLGYDVRVGETEAAYMATMTDRPDLAAWVEAAGREPWVIEAEEL